MISVIDGLGFGGAERSLVEMLPGLVAAGIHPTIVCLSHREGGLEDRVLADGYDVRFLPSGTRRRVPALRRMVHEASPALIHTTLVGSSLLGRVAAAGTRTPVLTSLVNQAYTPERRADPHVRPVAMRAVQAVDLWTARHLTAHFHAITNAVKRWAVQTIGVPPERVTVVERGRDPGRLGVADPGRRARARAMLGIAPDAEIVLAVGRQEYQKGHRFLLAAMEELAHTHPRAVLILAGRDGAESGDLRRIAASPPLDRVVRMLGHRHDIPEILAAADVFAFPSLWEGLGCSLLEAMALEVPIVASDLEPIREVVDDGRAAVLVPPMDARALATAISSVLRDRSEARALGARGREIFLRRFTLDRTTPRMISLFRWVASGQDRPRAGREVA